jgi:hypothetical protein
MISRTKKKLGNGDTLLIRDGRTQLFPPPTLPTLLLYRKKGEKKVE